MAFSERRLSIPADLRRLPEARQFAAEASAAYGFDEGEQYQIKLAMNEAVANAVEHGSSSAEETVDLSAAEEEGGLAFYIRDGGTFVPRVAPRGDLPERGRGLAFMSQLMDDVDVRPGSEGTTVRFSKRLAAG